MTRVALDAMGGDNAPSAVLDGVSLAIERGLVEAENVLLTGDEQQLVAGLEQRDLAGKCEVHHAPDSISCDESPVDAMRKKPNNSIAVGIGLVKAGGADAFISAGNTGMVVATAKVALRCLEGIRRPAIAVTILGEAGPFTIIDAGANPQPKANHLLQFGLMGSAYHKDAFGTAEPRVGLMNIGTEDSKGSSLTQEARALLGEAPINFVGNVEGVEIFRGACDVVVCDGFTGNVLLKTSEGVAEYMLRSTAHLMTEVGVADEHRNQVVGQMMRRVDYSEYGGALLLGVQGLVTICHGRSDASAICSAIRFAHRAEVSHLNQHIVSAARAVSAGS